MLECNQHLIDNPPRTLREACQWIAWYNMIGRIYGRDGAGCQLDEVLRPYYERGLATGLIDDETAIFYIACLLLNDTHYYQLSGPAPDGRDLTSKVSYLVLEAAHRLGIANNLTVRVSSGSTGVSPVADKNSTGGVPVPPDNTRFFLSAVGHLMRDRKGWPRFAGDKGLTEGFMRNGYPAELARQRIAVGCHWFAIPGREYTLNDIVKINVAKVFEVAFYDMIEDPCCGRDARQTHGRDAHATPEPGTQATTGPSVAELWRRFEAHLRRAVAVTARAIDFHLAHQKDNTPELTLNLLCHGTMEKGRDASDGGVEFYNMCVDGSGLATVADAFVALEQRIENEGVLSWEQIAQAIRTDWAGSEGERIRQMMLHSSRYGQNPGREKTGRRSEVEEEVEGRRSKVEGKAEAPSSLRPSTYDLRHGLGDQWAVKISRAFTAAVKEHNTPGGRNMIPGWFSWSATIRMGELVGATPDGRRAKSPISHGANPNNGFRSDGAATAMASAIAAVQTGYGNTCPIQLELSPGVAADEEGIARIASLIKTHFDQGGTLFNINIIDKDKLLAAHQDPAAFPDLIVRVTGFTAYFAVLSPAFRQLVVDRILES